MKKKNNLILTLLSVCLSAVLLFAVTACGGGGGGKNSDKNSADKTEKSDEPADMPTSEVVAEGLTYTLNVDNASYTLTSAGGFFGTEVTIPEKVEGLKVTAIGDGAFSGCADLESVSFSAYVKKIESSAFSGCVSLASILFDGTSSQWKAVSKGALWNIDFYKICTVYCFDKNEKTQSWYSDELPVPYALLTESEGLSYELNEGRASYTVTGIGTYEAASNDNIVVIPALYNDLPVTAIAESAFSPSGAQDYQPENEIYFLVIGDNVKTIGNNAFYNCKSIKYALLGNGVTDIGDGAFNRCTSLEGINVPDSVNTIGVSAFENTNLKSLTLGAGVESIGARAFKNCNKLNDFNISENVADIGDGAFSGCGALTDITLPASLTSIGQSSFANCGELTSIYFCGSEEEWNGVIIGELNDSLAAATKYFYSEAEPALNAVGTGYDGNFWHYDEDGKPVVWTK
ncbi:MAG: leucine-rich repeat protein [Clostridia bacterium]|nr:leucine-rich repeat protein [Clostridia bacterium]